MNASGDAAEQVVRLSLESGEYAVRIAGKGAEKIAVFLVAAMQGAKRTKGKTRLSSLLKSGKELKVFSLPEKDLKMFAAEAKKYGVLYAALRGIKRDGDGMVDIMCRAEDASKVNRIFDRFAITAIDTAEIRRAALADLEERQEQSRDLPEIPVEAIEQAEADNPQRESPHTEQPAPSNPTAARTAGSRSGASSATNRNSGTDMFPDTRGRPSVRQQLEEIRSEQRRDNPDRDTRQPSRSRTPTPKQKTNTPKSKTPKSKPNKTKGR